MAELVRKAGTKSVVRDYFCLKKKKGSDCAILDAASCWSCQTSIAAKHGKTSNLLTHLRIHHCELHSKVTTLMKSDKRGKETKESCPARAIKSFNQLLRETDNTKGKGKKWKELKDAVTYFLAKDALPKKFICLLFYRRTWNDYH